MESKRHIGRRHELAQLRTLLRRSRTGTGAAALVHGEAGVGVGRLVDEVRENPPLRTMLLSGRIDPEHPNPYAALATALRRPVRRLESREGRSVEREGARTDEDLRVALAALRTEEDGTPAVHTPGPVPPEVMALAVGKLLTLDGRSTLLVLEDLHEAHPELLDALRALVGSLTSLPLLLIGTWRTGVVPRDPDRGTAGDPTDVLPLGEEATTVELGRLTNAQTRRLVRSCLHEQLAPERLYRYVEESCAGLPLHVEDLLATLAQLGGIAPDPQRNRWQLTGRLSLAKPLSFADTVRVRLEHRGPESAAIIRAAAVVGMEFSTELLPRPPGLTGPLALDVPGGHLSPDQMLRKVRPGGYRFRHPLVREAVLGLMSPKEREEIAARLR